MKPLISVVIPTYNRPASLRRAVQSVMKQTCQDFEIIVVDDCSPENIEGVIKSFDNERIRYFRNEKNLGGAASRNRGIRVSEGEYIAFLDSDDEWLPEKLQKQLDVIRQDGAGLVFSGMYKIMNQREPASYILSGKTDFSDLLIRNCIGTCSVAFIKKELLERVGGFDESLPCCQDWDLYLRLSKICRFAGVQEALVNYTKNHDESRISNDRNSLLRGYDIILHKYSQDIRRLPPEQQAVYFHRIGRVFIEAGAGLKGLGQIWKAFIASKSVKYLYVYFKNLVFSLIVQWRIFLKGNLARG